MLEQLLYPEQYAELSNLPEPLTHISLGETE
jgi:hypothetical protein